jgi:ferredoxin
LKSPLETKSQEKANSVQLSSVAEGRLRLYDPRADNVRKFLDLLARRINRPLALSFSACVHCGLCAEACHYALARPDDPTMTPVYKADQIRRIFKRHKDWTGRIIPWWVHAAYPKDDLDLNLLKNIVLEPGAAAAPQLPGNWTPRPWFDSLADFSLGSVSFPRNLQRQPGPGNRKSMAITEEDYLERSPGSGTMSRTESGHRSRSTGQTTIPVCH